MCFSLLIGYRFLKASAEEVDKLREGKCPYTGSSLKVETLKEDKKMGKKYAGYHSEYVFKKTDENTVRGGLVNTRLYTDQWVEGVLQERWSAEQYGYSILYTQQRRTERRKNPDPERMEELNYIIETYTFEVENFGSLSKKERTRLKKICHKANFTYSYEE